MDIEVESLGSTLFLINLLFNLEGSLKPSRFIACTPTLSRLKEFIQMTCFVKIMFILFLSSRDTFSKKIALMVC